LGQLARLKSWLVLTSSHHKTTSIPSPDLDHLLHGRQMISLKTYRDSEYHHGVPSARHRQSLLLSWSLAARSHLPVSGRHRAFPHPAERSHYTMHATKRPGLIIHSNGSVNAMAKRYARNRNASTGYWRTLRNLRQDLQLWGNT